MSKRLIGYGYTNANGVATLDYDAEGNELQSSGYVGQGVGNVDISASAVIDGSTFVSETYEVIDGTFLDRGTDSDYSAWTSTDFTDTKISRDTECTTLTPEDDFDSQYLALANSDLCIEFDMNLTSSTSINFIRFVKNQWTAIAQINQNDLGINSNEWHHIKLAKSGNTVNIFVDNVQKTPKTLSDTTDGFRIVLSNTQVTDMKYKNFVVYPI